jgi:hypothetical protein
MEREQKLHEH